MRYLFTLIVLISLPFSCGQRTNSYQEVNTHVPKDTLVSMNKDSIVFRNQSYSITLITTYSAKRAKSSINENTNSLSEQSLKLTTNDSEFSLLDIPITFDSKQYTLGAFNFIHEILINEIGVLEGAKDDLIVINGVGNCNACPELFSFFNSKGECLWVNVSTTNRSLLSFGNFKDTFEQYGCDSIKWSNGDYQKAILEIE